LRAQPLAGRPGPPPLGQASGPPRCPAPGSAFRIAGYVLWPFGPMIKPGTARARWSVTSSIILFGWRLALGHLVTGLLLCPTVIDVPLGIANFKIIPISLVPLGTRILRTG
jgi:uncharacterized membrane protein YccF (DUF307 family)